MLIFLLLILAAHFFFQLFFFPAMVLATPSTSGLELSESLSEPEPASSAWELRMLVGLVGRGENVPWSQGPSCACSRTSSTPLSRAVDSVGRGGRCGVLGPACGASVPESACSSVKGDDASFAGLDGVKVLRRPLGWAGTWSRLVVLLREGGLGRGLEVMVVGSTSTAALRWSWAVRRKQKMTSTS